MGFPRLPSAVLVVALLLTGWEEGPSSAAGTHDPPESHSHDHAGVPKKFPEHPAVGEEAPDFSLRNLEGRSTALGEFLGRGYVVLFFGSASSSSLKKSAPQMDRLAKAWERLEVKVLLVYTREAHPAALRNKAPRDYGERAALARQVREDLKLGIPILVDEWDDAVHEAYGAMPDAAFLLDPRGTIVLRQTQAGAAALEKELRRLLKIPNPAR